MKRCKIEWDNTDEIVTGVVECPDRRKNKDIVYLSYDHFCFCQKAFEDYFRALDILEANQEEK